MANGTTASNDTKALREYDYVICARNIVGGREFGSNVGTPRFLKVPRSVPALPEHRIDVNDWLKEVVDLADGVADGVLNPKGHVLVFVHGYNNTRQEISDRHGILQETLLEEGWRGVVVSYDWPSDDSTLNYLEDRADAAATAQYLVTHGIGLIVKGQAKLGCETNIHLLGHSTGAYVIMEGFAQAQKVGELFREPWRIGQVAFIGADVAADSLDADCDWGRPLFARIMRLTNYSNGFDDVLAVSNAKRLGTAPRVGRAGLTKNADPKAVNVSCSDYFRAFDPDAQARKVGWWNHSWHIGNPVWTRDLAMTLEGRYDRSVIPTREMRAGGLHLREGERPPHEEAWRELVADYAARNPAIVRKTRDER
jgi:pimeloyl-ACP methyl ester carboxylesterase